MQCNSEHLSGVTVIIPVFNRAKTLIKTLSYVAAQTVLPEQLVIVDDGSTDDSAGAAERWLAAHAPALAGQVVRAPHGGAAAARNVGLRAMRQTPYVAFLDSDDHWPADFLQRTSGLLRKNPATVAASVDRRYLNESQVPIIEDNSSALAEDPIVWMFFNGAGIASCSLFRLDVVNRVGNWPESPALAEDLMLFIEVAQRGTWLHSPGLPVEFDLGFAAASGEEGNLSQRYEGDSWRWVCIYEQIYQKLCDRDVPVDRRKLQKAIAIVWNRAGKNLQTLGQRSEAQECFVRSIRWKPAQWRAWRRLALNAVLLGKMSSEVPV
jgi:glycosyltransferase involved in cell wall biosynthesis